ncbi:MAG: LOG family protein [Acidobacteriota bacterium]
MPTAEAPPAGRRVAVFGSSESTPGSPLYSMALAVGRLLAEGGFTVVTGGYGGVMEAACRGATQSGGTTVGITTRALSHLGRRPNPFLTCHQEKADLFARTRELIDQSAGYIILPGKAGTLAELTFLWALRRAQLIEDRPIVLLGAVWGRFLEVVRAMAIVDVEQLAITDLADTPEAAIDIMRKKVR